MTTRFEVGKAYDNIAVLYRSKNGNLLKVRRFKGEEQNDFLCPVTVVDYCHEGKMVEGIRIGNRNYFANSGCLTEESIAKTKELAQKCKEVDAGMYAIVIETASEMEKAFACAEAL